MLKKFFWIFFEKGSITILQFVTLFVLGRILSPTEYGIYGIMLVFIGIAEMLVDSGFGGAIIKKEEIFQQDIDTLFITNICISIFLYVLLYLFAPALESFYKIESLSIYFRVLGLAIIIYACSIVQNSLLIRNFKFKTSAIINLVSTLVSSIIAIIMAYYGCGIWSLIFQLIIHSILTTLLMWFNNRLKISLEFSKQSFRFFWNFGSNLVAGNILQVVVNNISTSIIPKIGDVVKAGYYFQSVKITNIPAAIINNSIDKGVFSVLSKEKTQSTLIGQARKVNRYFVAIFFPAFPLLSICAIPIINLLLGKQWIPASEYLSILLWSGIALMMQGIYRNIVKSVGDTRLIFKIEVIKSIISLLIILIALNYGIIMLVIGYVVASFVNMMIWGMVLCYKYTYSIVDQLKDLYKPIIATTIVYMSIYLMNLPSESMWNIVAVLFGYFIYLIISYYIGVTEIGIVLMKCKNKLCHERK